MEQIKKRGRPKKNLIEEKNSEIIFNNYRALLIMDNKNYSGEGETIHEAMLTIPLDYIQIKAKGTIKIFLGDKFVEKFFYLKPLRRLFANKLNKQLWARNFEKMLKDKYDFL